MMVHGFTWPANVIGQSMFIQGFISVRTVVFQFSKFLQGICIYLFDFYLLFHLSFFILSFNYSYFYFCYIYIYYLKLNWDFVLFCRFKLKFEIADEYGTAAVILFDRDVNQLLNTSCEDLLNQSFEVYLLQF